jgi:hypothetical protein
VGKEIDVEKWASIGELRAIRPPVFTDSSSSRGRKIFKNRRKHLLEGFETEDKVVKALEQYSRAE